MNVINQFLESVVHREDVDIECGFEGEKRNKVNKLFIGNEYTRELIRLRPKIKRDQIWTVKQEYPDYSGELQQINHPMMVLLTDDAEALDEDNFFVRGCPITPFVQMATEKDQICGDASIVGFPFLVEVWNEQPMLTDILDKYVGEYHTEIMEFNGDLSEEQAEFREIEISNARFLNHSIIAYTNEIESGADNSFSADLSFGVHIESVRMPVNQTILGLSGDYSKAAKIGFITTGNDSIDFNNSGLPFKIEVRKKSNKFIVTIIPKIEVRLTNDSEEEIQGAANSERIVYDNLPKGLYKIETPLTKEKITIRLK